APIFHFSEYEVETMKRLAKLYKTPQWQLERLLSRFVDLHHRVITSVILPVESYSLKSLANWIGFHWRDPGISGEQCVCWYDQWLKTEDRTLLSSILRYNEDDCRATLYLKNWLLEFLG
ncbi:MAG: TM0106 family RecB-like putative nuclease, partial [cyanobacterium endosymbiont of Rhopalodia inflata]